LVVDLKPQASSDPPNTVDNDRLVLRVPWKKTPMKRRRDIMAPASVSAEDRRPIRAETRAVLRNSYDPNRNPKELHSVSSPRWRVFTQPRPRPDLKASIASCQCDHDTGRGYVCRLSGG
jgi:hypothetical protein